MRNSYNNVPAGRMKDCAQGCARKEVPVRMNPEMLAAEACGLIWEQYPVPVELKRVLAGSLDTMTCQANAATRFSPRLPPQMDTLIDRNGSTNGFAAHVVMRACQKNRHRDYRK
jgi:beta-lactamase class C